MGDNNAITLKINKSTSNHFGVVEYKGVSDELIDAIQTILKNSRSCHCYSEQQFYESTTPLYENEEYKE